MRVLIADSLAEFVEREAIPQELTVELCRAGPLPGGDYVGIMPDITRPVQAADLERLPLLRVIANYGAGYDNIDVRSAREQGIIVCNTPGVLTNATAELTWALILAVTRRIGEGERLVRSVGWTGWQPTQLRGTSLEGKTLGIVGAGRIGSAVARRARAFNMHVVYTSRSAHPLLEMETGAARRPLEQLLSEADVVSLHVSLNNQTRHLIGARQLRSMKQTAFLINTARGSIIDETVLVRALQEGWIRGAGIDVYEHEPRVPASLTGLQNVVLLPHLGSATMEARLAMWQMAWANLLAGIRGHPVPNLVTD